MGRLTEKNPKWFTEILYVYACKPSESDIENLYRKLKRYEDLEEQGRLVELPCNVGEECYIVKTLENEHDIEIEKTVLKNTCLLTENENGSNL